METDAEIQSQTLGGAWGVLWKSGDRTEQARGVKDTTRRPTESTNLGPWGLTEPGPPTSRSWTYTPYTSAANLQLGVHVLPVPSGMRAI